MMGTTVDYVRGKPTRFQPREHSSICFVQVVYMLKHCLRENQIQRASAHSQRNPGRDVRYATAAVHTISELATNLISSRRKPIPIHKAFWKDVRADCWSYPWKFVVIRDTLASLEQLQQ